MNHQVLGKQIVYEGCPIVIRRQGETFEYITVVNGEIYSSFIVARRSFKQRILFKNYEPKQLHNITQYMLAMAQTTIDSVLGLRKPVDKDKAQVSPFMPVG